jgi:hypothetical protein
MVYGMDKILRVTDCLDVFALVCSGFAYLDCSTRSQRDAIPEPTRPARPSAERRPLAHRSNLGVVS